MLRRMLFCSQDEYQVIKNTNLSCFNQVRLNVIFTTNIYQQQSQLQRPVAYSTFCMLWNKYTTSQKRIEYLLKRQYIVLQYYICNSNLKIFLHNVLNCMLFFVSGCKNKKNGRNILPNYYHVYLIMYSCIILLYTVTELLTGVIRLFLYQPLSVRKDIKMSYLHILPLKNLVSSAFKYP